MAQVVLRDPSPDVPNRDEGEAFREVVSSSHQAAADPIPPAPIHPAAEAIHQEAEGPSLQGAVGPSPVVLDQMEVRHHPVALVEVGLLLDPLLAPFPPQPTEDQTGDKRLSRREAWKLTGYSELAAKQQNNTTSWTETHQRLNDLVFLQLF
ncbi:hypothetical protein Q5P01_021910 [Channa striata]|uniref:Uncharacterized protein n=1 Tax=Channa striata TaxID=64152 RepID=A0AA88RZ10_CHASR|nr:hypothetical protein Q5P01_021910 [Channa striata]